jgi:hypothetical protein
MRLPTGQAGIADCRMEKLKEKIKIPFISICSCQIWVETG